MGGTSGGPQALPSPPASGTEGAAAGSPSGGTVDVDDGGLYGDPIGSGSAPADLPAPLPPSFLTDGIGLGQPNLPDDVFFSSSLMAENGILDAPTFVATPEYLGGLETAQEMLGTKPDGYALKGGETDLAALQGARDGAVKLPATFASTSGPGANQPKTPSGPTVADDVSTPGRSMTQQVATVRKMKGEEASTKPATAKPIGPRLSDPMDLAGKAPAPQITAPEFAAPKIDPIKAASEFRHIATFKPGRFERNNAGTPTLQGVPLDAAKAELLEHALKARDANDLDAFEALLKRRDNSLTGPEKDFLRGVAENRFESTSDAEFEALTAEGLKTMGVEPDTGALAEPERPKRMPAGVAATQRRIETANGPGIPDQGEIRIRAASAENALPTPVAADSPSLKSETVTVGDEAMDLADLSAQLTPWDAIVDGGVTDEAGASYIDEAPEELQQEVGEALLGILPGTGEALEAKEAYQAFQAAREAVNRGDLSDAGINAALAAVSGLGAVPGVGKLAKAAKALAKGLVKSGRRAMETGARAARSVSPKLFNRWADGVLSGRIKPQGKFARIGVMDDAVKAFAKDHGIDVGDGSVLVVDHRLKRTQRPTKPSEITVDADLLRDLPTRMADPHIVLWDAKDKAFLHVFEVAGAAGKRDKLVVKVGRFDQLQQGDGKRQVTGNFLWSATRIRDVSTLGAGHYVPVPGTKPLR